MDSLTFRFNNDVFLPYLDLLRTGYRFHPTFNHAKKIWEGKLTAEELVNGPYLEKAQIYKEGEPLNNLPLHEKTKVTIRKRLEDRSLWKHQTDALGLLLNGKNAVIATGTSSGKTLCYQIPILDDLLRDPSPGLRAVIIYPLNALVNDQLTEWEKMLSQHPQITFARFTGQTPDTQVEYEKNLRETFGEQLADQQITQQELERNVTQRVEKQLRENIPNRLNHREAIRSNPPQILITNFSMLEYLLERPIDATIFQRTRLKFLVLDEAHAYRGVQATEIAFLVRRLKDRLGLEKLVCIATSATLGKQNDPESKFKVRKFASDLFNDSFDDDNPIYGSPSELVLQQPALYPTPSQYLKAAEILRGNPEADLSPHLGMNSSKESLTASLGHDGNLYRLRKEILTKPILLKDAAKLLWPVDPQAEDGIQALLEIIAMAKADQCHEDLLPTRLHYFVKAQDGLHICLHKLCPGRKNGMATFFVSRKSETETPEGDCPDCYAIGSKSKLVEVVTCRKCGYLYGAMQDLGPRRAQNPDSGVELKPYFDSFSTELGWVADSYWSYFSVEDDLPYPIELKSEDEDDIQGDLFLKPAELEWCVICGKKKDDGEGDNCLCEKPHLRKIKIFHRQCPQFGKAKDRENLYKQEKSLLTSCPNCGARNVCIEPVHRFQESDDEMGLAMAIPLANFQVSPASGKNKHPRKLLCFTDHRQRAAAFPSLLEEETFPHDMGRKIVEIVTGEDKPLDLVSLGERLADMSDPQSKNYDPDFFLPVSRLPDEKLEPKEKRNLWAAETFAYFGIPDSARESAEDLGLVAVEYRLKDTEKAAFYRLLNSYNLVPKEIDSLLQILMGYMRQRKAFTLPKGRVQPDDPAFGVVTADIAHVLRYEGIRNTNGWLPRGNRDSVTTDYLRRALHISREDAIDLAEKIWYFLISQSLLIGNNERNKWKLGHELLFVGRPASRFVCDRCGIITAYSVNKCCPRKECSGTLQSHSFNPAEENIIARWVSGKDKIRFTTLKSEEHTAQINKELAKSIEDSFRDGSINLLSSTTTFEMGISIGDLQKVLLRNAPPSSASYVQRVGRAGRDKDKNSVCVTLCRRTKYDGDAWNDPPRLMSGEVRTPTVFTQNKVIAQRHFNAVVFAKFLREKITDELVLGQVKQSIRLEFFLHPDARVGIPESWFQPNTLFLNFIEWLEPKGELDFFSTDAGRSLSCAVSDFESGKAAASKKYREALDSIKEELVALMAEYKRLKNEDRLMSAEDIGRSIKNLLNGGAGGVIDVLAKRGFLPRYAFPLDVVTLETGKTRWSRDTDVELTRDRGIAIAEFAPGAQIIAHKKIFTSEGLYVVSKMDKPKREWYSKCPACEQIRTAQTQEALVKPCSVCQRPITANQDTYPFIEPLAFSVRIEEKNRIARFRRSTLIRQRQTLTHFIDQVDNENFQDFDMFRLALKENGTLFRYNRGPENKGFMLCPECGCSEPFRGYKAGKKHKKLRTFSGSMECKHERLWTKPIAYGHQFPSFCLIARPTTTHNTESLAFALQKGLCSVLDIETSDIGVSWRRLANKNEKTGSEIILYDHTPGGAGFVKEGFGNWEKVVKEAKQLCANCTCEKACYSCLKNYGNQSHHEKLDRLSVVESLK